MKLLKVLIPICLLVAFLTMPASVALADDPPDVEVDVEIGSPGDVDVDVGIDAGGDVDVTVDGMDIRDEIGSLHQGVAKANRVDGSGSINTGDWYRYWYKEITPVITVINNLGGNFDLAVEAIAKLITEREVTDADLEAVTAKVNEHDKTLYNDLSNLEVDLANQGSMLLATQNSMLDIRSQAALMEDRIVSLDAHITSLEQDLVLLQREASVLRFWCYGLGLAMLILTFAFGLVMFMRRR